MRKPKEERNRAATAQLQPPHCGCDPVTLGLMTSNFPIVLSPAEGKPGARRRRLYVEALRIFRCYCGVLLQLNIIYYCFAPMSHLGVIVTVHRIEINLCYTAEKPKH